MSIAGIGSADNNRNGTGRTPDKSRIGNPSDRAGRGAGPTPDHAVMAAAGFNAPPRT